MNVNRERFENGGAGFAGWRARIGSGRGIPTPASADGTVIVGGGFGSHEVYALDVETGQLRWQVHTRDDGPTAAVVLDGTAVQFWIGLDQHEVRLGSWSSIQRIALVIGRVLNGHVRPSAVTPTAMRPKPTRQIKVPELEREPREPVQLMLPFDEAEPGVIRPVICHSCGRPSIVHPQGQCPEGREVRFG